MDDNRKICCHLSNLWLDALVEHLLQFVVLPSGFGHVMVGEDLSVIGCKESSAKNIDVHFRADPCEAHQGDCWTCRSQARPCL